MESPAATEEDASGQSSTLFHTQLQALAVEYDRLCAENSRLKLMVPCGPAEGFRGGDVFASTIPAGTWCASSDGELLRKHAVPDFALDRTSSAFSSEAVDFAVHSLLSDPERESLDGAAVRAAKLALRKERSWMNVRRIEKRFAPTDVTSEDMDVMELDRAQPILCEEALHATINSTADAGEASEPMTQTVSRGGTIGLANRAFEALEAVHGGHDPAKANRKMMFGPDSDAMKEQVRQQMLTGEAAYDVKNFYKTEGICQALARSHWFENTTLGMIAFYAIWMAIDTDYNDADVITEADPVFFAAEQVFCTFFFSELAIRFGAFRRKRDCMRDSWFVFDTLLVLAMVLEVWVMTGVVLAAGSSGSSTGALGNASILRVARLLRLSRLFRMARLVRMVPELLIMLKAILAATRSVAFTLMLLLIVLYVFGIAMVQTLKKDTVIGEEKFYNVAIGMQSLFLHGTLLDDVSTVLETLEQESPFGMILMYVFIIIAAITVMNMLIGVLCEVITAVAAAEKEAINVSWVKSILQDVMNLNADENTDGKLQKTEFFQMLQNREAVEALKAVDVDVVTLVDFADIIFEEKESAEETAIMNFRSTTRAKQDAQPMQDGQVHEESSISFADFMEMVLQLRMTNGSTVKDIVDLRKFMGLRLKILEEMIRQLQADMKGRGSSKMPPHQGRTPVVPLGAQGGSLLAPSQEPPELEHLRRSPTSGKYHPPHADASLPGQISMEDRTGGVRRSEGSLRIAASPDGEQIV